MWYRRSKYAGMSIRKGFLENRTLSWNLKQEHVPFKWGQERKSLPEHSGSGTSKSQGQEGGSGPLAHLGPTSGLVYMECSRDGHIAKQGARKSKGPEWAPGAQGRGWDVTLEVVGSHRLLRREMRLCEQGACLWRSSCQCREWVKAGWEGSHGK